MSRRVAVVVYLTLLAVALPLPAYAYVDPGSASVVFQAIVAGLAVAGTAVTMFWDRLRGLFRRNRG